MTARSQAQNSRIRPLAGPPRSSHDWDDRSASGPRLRNALAGSRGNKVMAATVDIQVADVEFPNDPAGQPNRVKTTVYRNAARGNPVATLVAQYFGIKTANIVATATAEASPADAMTCVLPFTIPDRWTEVQTPAFDPEDGFNLFSSKNVRLSNPDVYIGPESGDLHRHDAERDKACASG